MMSMKAVTRIASYGTLIWIGSGLYPIAAHSACALGTCITITPPSTSSGRPSGGGYAPQTYTAPSGPTPQQIQQQREQAMHDANDMGADAYRRGDYASALRYFQEALEREPDDPTLLDNLRMVRAAMQEESDRRTREAQARASKALEEARSAQIHGRRAAASPTSGEQHRVFDTAGTRAPGSADVVDARNPRPRVQIPPSLANNPEIRRLQADRAGLVGQMQSLEQKLVGIREQKSRGEGNRGQLEVQEAQTKQQISNVSSQIAVVDYKTESFVINLTRDKPPAQPQPSAQLRSQ